MIFSLCPFPLVLSVGTTEKSLAPPSFHLSIDKVSPEPSLLQAEQSQFSQPFPTEEMLQTLNLLCGPSLDSL